MSDIRDIIKVFKDQDIKLETPLIVVEMGYQGQPAVHTPYTNMHELLAQFAGGLRSHNILYIGFDEKKARTVHSNYHTAYLKSQELK